jgi:hypothetical protein
MHCLLLQGRKVSETIGKTYAARRVRDIYAPSSEYKFKKDKQFSRSGTKHAE